jgi:CRISPR/Cas system-associated endonuclease/helicase Cas3
LRKYLTVFLSNKIVSGKLSSEEILAKHISSKDRDYPELYHRIVGDEDVIFDLGAGVNGFSYKYIGKKYVAFEATRILVELMNNYFREKGFNAGAIWADLFDIEKIKQVIIGENGKKAVWMFNIVDALEIEPNFSKKFILELAPLVDRVVLSWPTQSLQKKRKFSANRNWIFSFIQQNYRILDNFEMNGEKFVVFSK